MLDLQEWRTIVFEKCIKCDRLGKDCVPNVFIMHMDEIREWARKLKAYKRMSNAELSKRSGVPKGTIDMHFSNKTPYSADVNYSTFAPILCALIGCDNHEMPCPAERKESEEENERIEYFKEQMRITQKTSAGRMKAVIILGVLFGITLILIILALLSDIRDPELGFLWRH